MIQVKGFRSVIDFEWFFNHWFSRYNYVFGILRFLPITKDRKQLRTANKNYLVIKQTSTHENIHPTLLLPGNGARKRS